MHTEQRDRQNCVYILKTGKNLYKIGRTRDLQKRLASYHTHLPILFRVIRQYPAANMADLEESLHVVFQHKRVKGEWFELRKDDLVICDNIARNYALTKLQKQVKAYPEIHYSDDPLMQVMEANEKYLRDYSKVADDIKLGLTIQEIVELHEGSVSKTTIETVRRLLDYQTPNSEYLHQWWYIVGELEAGLSEDKILEKYPGSVSRSSIRMIKRILRNQLY
ncbi:MAG: GIY-YIG nuclease family protein [Bacteroidota bacterium]